MPNIDYDFTGFTFGDKHSYRDLKIYRTSDGSRYNINLTAPIKDITTDVPGGDGQYLFDTKYAARQFSIPFAFDRLTEEEVTTLRRTFSGKEVKELIFDELPYKVYNAKVSGTPVIKVIPFTETLTNGTVNRVYRGEGTIQFTCHYPFAHTPDWYWKKQGDVYTKSRTVQSGANTVSFNGKNPQHYLGNTGSINPEDTAYPTYEEWKTCLNSSGNYYLNSGELPAPFILQITPSITTVNINGNTIKLKQAPPDNWFWDSRLGLIFTTDDGNYDSERSPLLYEGNACQTISVNNTISRPSGVMVLDFKNWYY